MAMRLKMGRKSGSCELLYSIIKMVQLRKRSAHRKIAITLPRQNFPLNPHNHKDANASTFVTPPHENLCILHMSIRGKRIMDKIAYGAFLHADFLISGKRTPRRVFRCNVILCPPRPRSRQ